jgi:hypothetical protein
MDYYRGIKCRSDAGVLFVLVQDVSNATLFSMRKRREVALSIACFFSHEKASPGH